MYHYVPAVTNEVTNEIDHLIRVLYEHEFASVTAHFSGSDDSGAIREIKAITIDGKRVDEDSLRYTFLPDYRPPPPEHAFSAISRNFETHPYSLYELIADAAELELEARLPGWEINDGTHGTIVFHVDLQACGRLAKVKSRPTLDFTYYPSSDLDEDDED